MKKDNSLYNRLLVLSYEIEKNIFFESIAKGFLMMMPVLFIGAVALVIKSFPILGIQGLLSQSCGGLILLFLDEIYQATYGLLSLYLTIGISLSLSRKLYQHKRYTQGLNVVLSIICLAESLGIANGNFSYTEFGNTGVFTAIVVSLIVPVLYKNIQRLLFGKDVQDFLISDEINSNMFMGAVVPFVLCIVIFFVLNIVFFKLCGCSNLNEMFATFFGFAFKSMGSTLSSGLLFLFCSGLLWFFGIHGGNAFELVSQNIFVPTNTNPNVIMSKTFLDVFGLMGGCGATICLIIAVLLFSRKNTHRNLAKVAMPMVLFNVNEIMVFGLPIIFNPIMLIPFILTPMVSVTIAYAAAYCGLMPIPTAMIEWTTPVLLSGYALTGSISGLIVQLIGIVCGVGIYTPFVKMLGKVEQSRDNFLIGELEEIYMNSLDEGSTLYFSKLNHGIRSMSATLTNALMKDIRNHKVGVYYQPQFDRKGKMVGVEALLRWEYHGRKILPPLVVALARENQMINALSVEVLKRSADDIRQHIEDNPKFKLSINMVAEQINDSTYIREFLMEIQRLGICRNICILNLQSKCNN